ncbi:hypothetical protein [Nocardia sp. XZ_19_385]|uniref:hypothetical protein n=1 Tax=Nocardia sp. XZ_19_385 TaxID=2769488 RepID=UPI00188F4A46|nr:hypothetical protein [Nocardia sp. XZ_19_385]
MTLTLGCPFAAAVPPDLPFIGEIATGSGGGDGTSPGGSEAGTPLRLGPLSATAQELIQSGSASGSTQPTDASADAGKEIALRPAVAPGLDSGSVETACAGSAVLGGSMLVLALLTGSGMSSGSALLGSSGSVVFGSSWSVVVGSAAVGSAASGSGGSGMSGSALGGALGSAGLGSAAVGSAATGSAVLTCLALLLPSPSPPAPGIPLAIPPFPGQVPPVPGQGALLGPGVSQVAQPTPPVGSDPATAEVALPGVAGFEPAENPVGWDLLEIVVVLIVAILVTQRASSVPDRKTVEREPDSE